MGEMKQVGKPPVLALDHWTSGRGLAVGGPVESAPTCRELTERRAGRSVRVARGPRWQAADKHVRF